MIRRVTDSTLTVISLVGALSFGGALLGEPGAAYGAAEPRGCGGEGVSALTSGPVAGQIVVDAEHPAWFRYHEGGPFFLCGPGDPEGFLYRGARNADGTRNGDQMALIDKLTGTGANAVYLMAVRSHGGDGGTLENPFIDGDPANAISDVILDQWETWFTEMDNHGIVIYFLLYDDAACLSHPLWDTGDEVGEAEACLIDTLVNRFKHHRHLIWCVKEEYSEGLSPARVERIAERIRAVDDAEHPIAIHQLAGTSYDFNGSAVLHQFAAQFPASTVDDLHTRTLAAWNDVGGAVNVNVAEFPNPGTGSELRRKLWSVAMGGGYVMALGMDIASTSIGDLESCGHLVAFMESTAFSQTAPHDELGLLDTRYVLGDPGSVYIVYGVDADTLGLEIEAGAYAAVWYDPATGVWIENSSINTGGGAVSFAVPPGLHDQVVLYLEAFTPPPATGHLALIGGGSGSCVEVGAPTVVTLEAVGLSDPITGVLAAVTFDPAMLSLDAVEPTEPWAELVELIDGGELTLLASAESGVVADGEVGALFFTALTEGTADVRFRWSDGAPASLLVLAEDGSAVVPTTSDAGGIAIATPACAIVAAEKLCPFSTGNIAHLESPEIGDSYDWSIAGGVIESGDGTSLIQYTVGSSATVTLSVEVLSSAGCVFGCEAAVPVAQSNIGLDIQMVAVGESVTRNVTFSILDNRGAIDVRVRRVTFDATGHGAAEIDGIDPDAAWISASSGAWESPLSMITIQECDATIAELTLANRICDPIGHEPKRGSIPASPEAERATRNGGR